MFKTDFSEIKDREAVNFTYNSSPDAVFRKGNRDQWRNVLGTFDLIKDKTLVNQTKNENKSSNKKIIRQDAKSLTKTSAQRRIILSPRTNTINNKINERNGSQANLEESDIIWSSSNEDSDSCLDFAILNKRTNISRFKGHIKRCHHEADINWSSSNESENEENICLNEKRDISRCKKYLKRKLYESEINWSSSNESENEANSTQKSRLCGSPKKKGSDCELDSFVREIEKDLRRTKKINLKLTNKKGGYVENFRKAVNKAKADTGFLDYEQRVEIICGCKGVITEKKASYGSYLANIRLESGSNCFIFLGKNMKSSNNGSAVVCFLDESHCYTVDNRIVYLQPNKVIRA